MWHGGPGQSMHVTSYPPGYDAGWGQSAEATLKENNFHLMKSN